MSQVTLIPVNNANGFQWQMSLNGGAAGGPNNYPHVPVDQTTGPTIVYTIRNPGVITFDPGNPISVQAGSAKPAGGVDQQFTWTLSADPQGHQNTVLTLNDSNLTKGPYSYVMNFVNAKQLDPIIDNSGPHVAQSTLLYYAIGGVALIAIIALFIRAMQRRASSRS
jgi:hypothetical protein